MWFTFDLTSSDGVTKFRDRLLDSEAILILSVACSSVPFASVLISRFVRK